MNLWTCFLTNGGKAIPIVIVMDEQGNYQFNLGPRPKAAQNIFKKHRSLSEQGKIEKSEVIKKNQKILRQRPRTIYC